MKVLQVGDGRVEQVSFDPGRSRLAVAVRGQPDARIVWYDTRTWGPNQVLHLTDCACGVTCIERNDRDEYVTDPRTTFPDGPTAFALSHDHRRVKLAWPAFISWKWQQISEWEVETGRASGPSSGGRDVYAEWMAFSLGGRYVMYEAQASASSEDRVVHFLGALGRVFFYPDRVRIAAFTADDKTLAYGNDAGLVRFWEVAPDSKGGYTQLPGDNPGPALDHGVPIRSLAFGPNGRALAVGTGFGLTLWRVADRARLHELLTDGPLTALAFSADGQRVATISPNGNAHVCGVVTGALCGPYNFAVGPLTCVAFSPDGLTCAAGGENGQVVVWDVDA